jgi:carboxyl-terminal processing protease
MAKSRTFPRILGIVAIGTVTVSAVIVSIAAPSVSDLALIAGVMDLVKRNYVHPVEPHVLAEDALKGMLSRLDPHSDYMNEQEFKETVGTVRGKFGGLGIEISDRDGVPSVISAIEDTPAAQAGLQPGDLIVGIDSKSTQDMPLNQVVTTLRGEPGTTVKLIISRGTAPPFDVTLTRSTIHVQSVKSRLEANGIGYVRVTEFSDETPAGLTAALTKLKQDAGPTLKGLVLDLRNDPGGLLNAAVEVAGAFLDGGTVVSIRGRRQNENKTYPARANGDRLRGIPIVVLINGASASASEIVAGALQDRHRATVMGTRSFGKGSVQSIIPLSGHGALLLTTALYFTPSGRSIQAEGISPDVVVEVPKDQQVEGAMLLGEDALAGAITNQQGARQPNATRASETPTYSAPIKPDLIGGPSDAQLQTALSHLAKAR